MSFQPGGWNNNIQRIHFTSESHGNAPKGKLKEKAKKEPSDCFNATEEINDEFNFEFKKSLFALLWDFILSIYKMIFRIKTIEDTDISKDSSFNNGGKY